MSNQIEEEIEFIPSDEIVETEPVGPEDDALHVREGERSDEAADVDAGDVDDEQADETGAELRGADEADAGPTSEAEEEHEADVSEILRRHYGIVSDEPDEELTSEDAAPPAIADGEFVCQSCFLRKSAAQLTDPAQHICLDCAVDRA